MADSSILEGINTQGLLGKAAYRIPAPPVFKVGDKVKIVGPAWTQGYSNIIGKKGTITEVDTDATNVPYKVTFQSEVPLWFVGESLKLLPPEPQMYICLKAGTCERMCSGKLKHERSPLCDDKVCGAKCIPVEAKAEKVEPFESLSKIPFITMPDGSKVTIPMSRRQAQIYGIIRGKSAIRQSEKRKK